MGWFHTHDWTEIARTWAPPTGTTITEVCDADADDASLERLRLNERAQFGVTTILWKCIDPDCQNLRKEEMLGEQVEPVYGHRWVELH